MPDVSQPYHKVDCHLPSSVGVARGQPATSPGEHEAKTIGIVLCSEKNDAMVKITLPEDDGHVLAARYQMYLPTEEELRAELTRERREAERVVRLAAATRNVNDPRA